MNRFLVEFITYLTTILMAAIFLRAIISWFPLGQDNPVVTLLYQVTEPILAPIRRVLPRVAMFDFSPMVAIAILVLIQQLVRAFVP